MRTATLRPKAALWIVVFIVGMLNPLSAAQLEWIGGTDSSWHTPGNWAPIIVPDEDPIQRIPQEGDTVLLADITHGSFVQLDGDSPRLAGLEVANGLELNANGHFLLVEDEGAANTIVRGEGTRLVLRRPDRDLQAFQTDLLEVLDSGVLMLLDTERFNDSNIGNTAHILHGRSLTAQASSPGVAWQSSERK